jgi:hypothetical protein
MTANLTTTRPTKSQLMTAYNIARFSRKVEPGRLNRAFGIAQSKHAWQWQGSDLLVRGSQGETYHANGVCQCRDYTHRHVTLCKHRTARFLLMKAAQL